MKILVIGSGGREHAIIWKLAQSAKVDKIYCAPGNGGISTQAECVNIDVEDVKGLLKFVKDNAIDLTVVGPEVPLVLGIVDLFELEGCKIFGPKKYAAQLEGSKAFAKEFMQKYDIPTASFAKFCKIQEALSYLEKQIFPVVIKADGLASGKGVFICENFNEAKVSVKQLMEDKVFKDAGSQIVIEEYLSGEEISIFAICDGEDFLLCETSQDHKRVFDGDKGPNTGGMGAYSPAPIGTEELVEEVRTKVAKKVLYGMKKEGCPFKGILYIGIMVTDDGIKVLEFNVRFGDPETQAILPRLKNDLSDVMIKACLGELGNVDLQWDEKACVCVVMASRGYPKNYEKGKEIFGLDRKDIGNENIIFHAGTKREGNKIITSGGRVLGIVGLAETIESAIKKSYECVDKISFEGAFYRTDIGFRALNKKIGKY